MPLTLTPLNGIPFIHAGDDLFQIMLKAVDETGIHLATGDILVIAQKIISKAEGRLVNLSTVKPSPRAVEIAGITEKDPRFVELVLQESKQVLRMRQNTLIVEHRNGYVCANAGIDHSNVQGDWGNAEDWVLLLPEDSDRSAQQLCSAFDQRLGIQIGVLIIDSHGRAWRLGTVGTTIGVGGMPALVDLRGKPDLLGFRLRITQVAAADELAAAASLVMGQADEASPVVHVRGFPYPLREGSFQELVRPSELDLFR
ncbi:MAG: coenzyme F420-0:L-glutamate ligase [Chloroflexi bacterium]|nr:coenzyme F420-0:L-glutamate ligase [Chloroflexota bacterium]